MAGSWTVEPPCKPPPWPCRCPAVCVPAAPVVRRCTSCVLRLRWPPVGSVASTLEDECTHRSSASRGIHPVATLYSSFEPEDSSHTPACTPTVWLGWRWVGKLDSMSTADSAALLHRPAPQPCSTALLQSPARRSSSPRVRQQASRRRQRRRAALGHLVRVGRAAPSVVSSPLWCWHARRVVHRASRRLWSRAFVSMATS